MPEGFNSDVIRYCEISKKLTSWTEKAPICKGTVMLMNNIRARHHVGQLRLSVAIQEQLPNNSPSRTD